MLRVIILLFLLASGVVPAMGDDYMTSELICPCECAMVISTCDCTTAIQVKTEISGMKEKGFSKKQIFSALQAEYGKEILAPPEKDRTSKLWVIGAALGLLLAFVGYIFSRKTKMHIIPDMKKYEQQFEEEYRNFVSEIDETNKNENHVSNDTSKLEEKQ